MMNQANKILMALRRKAVSARLLLLLSVAATLSMPGCSRDGRPSSPQEDGSGELRVLACIGTYSDAPVTRMSVNPIMTTGFSPDDNIGLYIAKSGTLKELMSGYGRIRASYVDGTSWNFYQNNNRVAFPTLYLNTLGGDHADVYAYYPYYPDITDMTAIPCDLTSQAASGTYYWRGQRDMMYAEENLPASGDAFSNKHLDCTQPNTASFHFRHAMTLLCFRFTMNNVGHNTSTTLKSVTLDAGDNTTMYNKATFDITTGRFTPTAGSYVQKLSLTFNQEMKSDVFETYYMIFPAEVHAADDGTDSRLSIDLNFNDLVKPHFTLTMDQLTHKDASGDAVLDASGHAVTAFQPGYRYIFDFHIDNYVHLKGIHINGNWVDEPEMEILR